MCIRDRSKYPKESLGLGSVVVSCGERYRALALYDLFNVDSQTGAVVSSKVENAVTNAIMLVTNANPTTVTVLTGVNTGDVSGLTSLLKSNGYLIQETDILTGKIDPNSSIVILAAPMVDIPAESLKKIDEYLDNGGKTLYYFADSTQPELPNIDVYKRQVNGNAFASTMCTGNLRSATERLWRYHLTKDRSERNRGVQYLLIILFFIVGAAMGAWLSGIWGVRAILFCCVLLAGVFGVMFIKEDVPKRCV